LHSHRRVSTFLEAIDLLTISRVEQMPLPFRLMVDEVRQQHVSLLLLLFLCFYVLMFFFVLV
jgi:hypothetical protein